ncbi:MAG: hypothetical protein WC381_10310 [Kiritimatiellia bacterium]|jgi:hypothetical protein
MRKRTGYLIRRGKVYYATWKVSGKRFMQTTGKRDRREAEKELHRIMEPFVAGDEATTLQNIAAKIEGRKVEIAQLEDERNPPLSIAHALDNMNAKNWRMVKNNLLATLPPAVVGS